jgi:hypothetical protein
MPGLTRPAASSARPAPSGRRLAPTIVLARSAWQVELRNGKPFPVHAAIEGAWLVLRTPLPGACIDRWDALLRNSRLPGTTKLLTEAGQALLGAEVPITSHLDRTVVPPCAAAALIAAHEALASPATGVDRQDEAPAGAESARLEQLARSLADAGWEVARTSERGCLVKLDTAARHQASVEPAGGYLRASVELTAPLPLGPTCRRALGTLLLAAANELRLVRPAAECLDDKAETRFEARLGPTAAPADLDLALGGLAVAAEQFGREARALTTESTARRYLTHLNLSDGE